MDIPQKLYAVLWEDKISGRKGILWANGVLQNMPAPFTEYSDAQKQAERITARHHTTIICWTCDGVEK